MANPALGQKIRFHIPLNNNLLLDGISLSLIGFSLSLSGFFSLPGWVFPSPWVGFSLSQGGFFPLPRWGFPSPKVAFCLCPQRILSLAPLPSGSSVSPRGPSLFPFPAQGRMSRLAQLPMSHQQIPASFSGPWHQSPNYRARLAETSLLFTRLMKINHASPSLSWENSHGQESRL